MSTHPSLSPCFKARHVKRAPRLVPSRPHETSANVFLAEEGFDETGQTFFAGLMFGLAAVLMFWVVVCAFVYWLLT